MSEWWKDQEYEIATLSATDGSVSTVVAREVDGAWEYAIVDWFYGFAAVRVVFKNGTAFPPNGAKTAQNRKKPA